MKRHPIKKGSTQPMAIFLYFLIVMLLVTKWFSTNVFEKDIVLLIAKESVPLSSVEAPIF
jgi:hypothetical protein